MGPLDRYAFRIVVSLALHATLALVCGVAAAVLAPGNVVVASLLGTASAVNALLGLREYARLTGHAHGH